MKLYLVFALLVVIGMIASGCTQPVPPANTTPAHPAATAEPVGATGVSGATLSDAKPNASLVLDPGVLLVSFQADGPQTLQFDQACKKSWAESVEIRVNRPYNGTLAFGIPTKDGCTVNISGSGTWTAQVSPMQSTVPLKVPVNLSGPGTSVSPSFMLGKGQYIFQREKTLTASPAYSLMFVNGTPLMDANNSYVQPGFTRDSAETFRILDIPESGTYILGVIAEENPLPWNASIVAMPGIPVMGPGPAVREKV